MTAELLGPLRHPAHRFTLGDAEVTTILDGTIPMGIRPPFLLDKDDEQIAAIATAANLPTDRLENNFIPTLVNTGSELVLFDTGCGHFRRNNGAGFLLERLADAGYAPGDIDVVALTHVHPDHIGGILEDGEIAFPNAQLMIGRREFDEWNSGANIPPQRAENREMFLKLIAPLAERFVFLEDGDRVASGVTAEAAFGHSIGQMMFRIESSGKQVLVWGDIANHFVFSVGNPDSPVGFDDDKDTAIATRRRVLDMCATDGLLIAGHHMPYPSVGYVERNGDAYRWTPAAYQLRL
ncbi:MBL fold metallo-hydrolase [Silicimonas sp. MF1-12-2]|uniref:MBL fold metallo-hydrolase n=1 Tax=Silicimonas sp. MF1-12-2 TaxID=3384793 RepID=UPI0039B5FA2B